MEYAIPSICLKTFFNFVNIIDKEDKWLGLGDECESNIISPHTLLQTIIQKYADEFFDGVYSFTYPEELLKIEQISIELGCEYSKGQPKYSISKPLFDSSLFYENKLDSTKVKKLLFTEKNIVYHKLFIGIWVEFSVNYEPLIMSEHAKTYSSFSITPMISNLMVRRSFEIWNKLSRKQLERGMGLKQNHPFAKSIAGQLGGLNNLVLKKDQEYFVLIERNRLKRKFRELFPTSGIKAAQKRAYYFRNSYKDLFSIE